MRNRFKGRHLIDRVPDELWTEVCDTVEQTESKTIPKKKKCKKANFLSGEALQIAVKSREVKSKGEKTGFYNPCRLKELAITEQKEKILRRGGKNTQKNCTKKIFMTQIIMMV